jgi:hypothetical protein
MADDGPQRLICIQPQASLNPAGRPAATKDAVPAPFFDRSSPGESVPSRSF